MSLFSTMELPQAAYDETDQGVASVSLWRAVLDRAVDDTLLPPHRTTLIEQAEAWLNGQDKDFQLICYLAMLEPKFVHEQAKNYIATQRANKRSTKREGASSGNSTAQRGDNPDPGDH